MFLYMLVGLCNKIYHSQRLERKEVFIKKLDVIEAALRILLYDLMHM